MDFKVQFFKSTKAQYDSITPDEYTFYYTIDTKQVFLGSIQLSGAGDFNILYDAILNLTQRLNGLESNSAKMIVVDDNNKDFIQSQPSNQKTFYVYYNRSETNAPDIKIGDGSTTVSTLPYLLDGVSLRFESLERYINDVVKPHIENKDIHIQEMEYVNSEDKQTYGDITERDWWNDKTSVYTTQIVGGIENQISSQAIANTNGDFCLVFDNSSIIVKDNIPRRIQYKE